MCERPRQERLGVYGTEKRYTTPKHYTRRRFVTFEVEVGRGQGHSGLGSHSREIANLQLS